MSPRILESTGAHVMEAARRLRRGDVLAFPTETVYGLGADASNPAAVAKIFALKGRPADNPLIVHVSDAHGAAGLSADWNPLAGRLAATFWPGPLTLVVRRNKDRIPDEVTAGRDTVAVRSPRHPVARRLLEAFDGPIAAPSANRSGRVSPTAAEHVAADFADAADLLILDGGPCEVGIESTVVDVTGAVPRVLRPGSVTIANLRAIAGDVEEPAFTSQAHSPGTAASHYAPQTPCELLEPAELAKRLAHGECPVAVLCFHSTDVKPPHRAIVMPRDPAGYARRMYEGLREADAAGLPRILIERPPTSPEAWLAIHDRLRRASAHPAC